MTRIMTKAVTILTIFLASHASAGQFALENPFPGANISVKKLAGGTAFPREDAGMSAYVRVEQPISLEKLIAVFKDRKVEDISGSHIIGIVPIANFGTTVNVHLYADADGWLVAYMGRGMPGAYVAQWEPADVNAPRFSELSTTLEDALVKAREAAELVVEQWVVKYYNFEYPSADRMAIFTKTQATTGSTFMQVALPVGYTYYESSYYHYTYDYSESLMKVDGQILSGLSSSLSGGGEERWKIRVGSYNQSLTPESLHTIEISYSSWATDHGSAGVAVVLIYGTAR